MENIVRKQFTTTIRDMLKRGGGTMSQQNSETLKRNVERAAGLDRGSLDVPGSMRSAFVATVYDIITAKPERNKIPYHRIDRSNGKTMYIMMGPTGAGKTTYAEKLAKNTGAVIVSSDAHKSARKKINAAVNSTLASGKSVIVNATHPTRERREELASIAKRHGVSTRCIRLDVPRGVAAGRSKLEGRTKYIVAATYFKSYEEPGDECDRIDVLTNTGPVSSTQKRRLNDNRHNAPKKQRLDNATRTEIVQAMLAHKYEAKHHGKKFHASEKLDGIRALFRNGKLYTRSGLVIDAPSWFLAAIPPGTYDGELFVGRGKFTDASSIVMGHAADPRWKDVTYRVFDDWDSKNTFSKTYNALARKLPHCSDNVKRPVCLEKHTQVDDHDAVQRMFDNVIRKGGEGLMLRANTPYKGGRTNSILKVKKMHDAEAKVVDIEYDGDRIKSLVCRWISPNFKTTTFKVGSGLDDATRRRGAITIGDVITVQYFELFESGKPRFPVFKGIRRNVRFN